MYKPIKLLVFFTILTLVILPGVYAEQKGNDPLKFSGKGIVSLTSGAFSWYTSVDNH